MEGKNIENNNHQTKIGKTIHELLSSLQYFQLLSQDTVNTLPNDSIECFKLMGCDKVVICKCKIKWHFIVSATASLLFILQLSLHVLPLFTKCFHASYDLKRIDMI